MMNRQSKISTILPKYLGTFLIVVGMFLVTCSKEVKDDPAGTVLAQVGSRVITVQDFIRRSEFSLRPDFCAGSSNIHKKIVLNNLIAEKILSLEEGKDSSLDTSKAIQAYLKGQSEQAMRQWLFSERAVKKVIMNEEEVHRQARIASRSYSIQYFTSSDTAIVNRGHKALNEGKNIYMTYLAIFNAERVPQKTLSWFDDEEPMVHQAFFSKQLKKGDILSPFMTLGGSTLFAQIVETTDDRLISGREFESHLSLVREKMKLRMAISIHDEISKSLMRGQEFLMNEPVFLIYAQSLASHFFQTAQDKKELFNAEVWNVERSNGDKDLSSKPQITDYETLFTLNGEPWTMGQFKHVIQRHPLVYRNRDMAYSDFPQQLKFAIADLLLDLELTEMAYESSYNQVPSVTQYVELWEDQIRSSHYRSNYLKRVIPEFEYDSINRDIILNDYLRPLIDSLQSAYSDQIHIDMKEFDKIQLLRTPAIATRENVPFPLYVPSFPVYTNEHRIDYGSIGVN